MLTSLSTLRLPLTKSNSKIERFNNTHLIAEDRVEDPDVRIITEALASSVQIVAPFRNHLRQAEPLGEVL